MHKAHCLPVQWQRSCWLEYLPSLEVDCAAETGLVVMEDLNEWE